MTWFTEDPTMILIGAIGGVVIAVLGVMLAKTGRVLFLGLIVLVGIIIAGCVLIERRIVTPREEVEMTLEAICQAFEANDADAVLLHIAPVATPTRRAVRRALNIATLDEAKITDGPRINVDLSTNPPSATADFVALGRGRLKTGAVSQATYPTKLFVNLERVDGHWLITRHESDSVFDRR